MRSSFPLWPHQSKSLRVPRRHRKWHRVGERTLKHFPRSFRNSGACVPRSMSFCRIANRTLVSRPTVEVRVLLPLDADQSRGAPSSSAEHRASAAACSAGAPRNIRPGTPAWLAGRRTSSSQPTFRPATHRTALRGCLCDALRYQANEVSSPVRGTPLSVQDWSTAPWLLGPVETLLWCSSLRYVARRCSLARTTDIRADQAHERRAKVIAARRGTKASRPDRSVGESRWLSE